MICNVHEDLDYGIIFCVVNRRSVDSDVFADYFNCYEMC